jgi:hypothetical protein
MERIISLAAQPEARSRRITSIPEMPGIFRSRMAKSGLSVAIISTAAAPSEHWPRIDIPLAEHRAAIPSRTMA